MMHAIVNTKTMIHKITSMEGEGGDVLTWGSKISKLIGCGEGGKRREEGGGDCFCSSSTPGFLQKGSLSSLFRYGLGLFTLIGSTEWADVPAAAGVQSKPSSTLSHCLIVLHYSKEVFAQCHRLYHI